MHALSRITEPAHGRGAATHLGLEAGGEATDPRDALTQTLFAANLVAGTLSADPALPAAAREQAHTLARLVRGALGQTRLLVFDRPPGFGDRDAATPTLAERLHDAAAALAAHAGGEVRVHADEAQPPASLRDELCRLAQAALAQVVRSAAAEAVHLRWQVGVAHAGPAAPRCGRLSVSGGGGDERIEIELRWHDPPKERSDKAAQATHERERAGG